MEGAEAAAECGNLERTWFDQEAASKLSTQYSFTRPLLISPPAASTMPAASKSAARPCSAGNTSTGRPEYPYLITVPAVPMLSDRSSAATLLTWSPAAAIR